MKVEINTYFALLIITVFASLATALIVHVVYNNSFIILIGEPGDYTVLLG